MYTTGQYLWDRENKEPVQFQGIILSYEAVDGKAKFLFSTFHGGITEELIFTKWEQWAKRFKYMRDGETKAILD